MQKIFKISAILTVIAASVGIYLFAKAAKAQTASSSPPPIIVNITPDMLSAAGFTNPTVIQPTADKFLPPVFYFQVKESAGAEAQNVVAILVKPMADKSWTYNNGQMETLDMGGKPQARIGGGGYYIVVTGPDKNKTINLAQRLKTIY